MTTPGFWLPYEWVDCPRYWRNFVRVMLRKGTLVVLDKEAADRTSHLDKALGRYGAKLQRGTMISESDTYVEFESDEAFTRFLLEFA